MKMAIEFLDETLLVFAGRANTHILDGVRVELRKFGPAIKRSYITTPTQRPS